ncbi:MAG: sigma 54-interacting transcriptional regulator [Thermodesulfobacteriota bacterium]
MAKRNVLRETLSSGSRAGTKEYGEVNGLLRFERLLSDLSATFVNLPSERVDQEIERWMGRIGTFLEMRVGTLAQLSEDRSKVRFTHTWAADGLESLSRRPSASSWPWTVDQINRGNIVQFTNVDELPAEARIDKERFKDVGAISNISIPLSVAGTVVGALSFSSRVPTDVWPDSYVERYRLIGDVFANALMRSRSDKALQKAFQEIKALKEQLEAENIYLRGQVRRYREYEDIIGESDAIQRVLRQVEQVAETDATVLIQGETGTGKELIADAIHRLSRRRDRVLVKVNCAAIPETLIESEIFGREKGAFTGASTRQIGRFETAHRGTILLDEVGELPLRLQSKLLRVLQGGTFERLGSSKTVTVDVRVIASTNRDLTRAVHEGMFRPDLYYRLNVFAISMPPLRERKEDIPALVQWCVGRYAKKMEKKIDTIPSRVMAAFQRYDWPGNVRELMNAIERSLILTQGTVLNAEVPMDISSPPAPVLSLAQTERNHILQVLNMTRWRVRGRDGAAQLLQIKPTTLESRMAKLGIRRPR